MFSNRYTNYYHNIIFSLNFFISSGDDAGSYRIESKTVNGLVVEIGLSQEGGNIEFTGSAGLNFSIKSNTETNLFSNESFEIYSNIIYHVLHAPPPNWLIVSSNAVSFVL